MEKFRVLLYRTLAVLVCLTLFSLYLLCGMYAKYASQSETADAARVAEFNVTATNPLTETLAIEMNPWSPTYPLKITASNNSEVSVRFYIKIEPEGTLPLVYTGSNELTQVTGENTWYYDVSATDRNRHDLYIDISWDPQQQGYEYAGGVEIINMTVSAEQID